MVLVPEIVDAVHPTPVLAAGGIGCGRQAAAAMALGAQGVWLGSLWLTSEEYKLEPQTERGMSIVQKSTDRRQLIRYGSITRHQPQASADAPTEWTEAWTAEGSPGTLPMPLQGMLVAEAEARIRGHQSQALLGSPVGQIVGQDESRSLSRSATSCPSLKRPSLGCETSAHPSELSRSVRTPTLDPRGHAGGAPVRRVPRAHLQCARQSSSGSAGPAPW